MGSCGGGRPQCAARTTGTRAFGVTTTRERQPADAQSRSSHRPQVHGAPPPPGARGSPDPGLDPPRHGDGGPPAHRRDDRRRAARPHRRRPVGHRHPRHALRRGARRRPGRTRTGPTATASSSARATARRRCTPRSPTAGSSRRRSWTPSWRRCPRSTAIPTGPRCPGVETNTGPLGHGFPVAVGCALGRAAARAQRCRTFVVLGDGELQEGSNWEAAMTAGHYGLDSPHRDRRPQPAAAGRAHRGHQAPRAAGRQVASFGWEVREVDGHDHAALLRRVRAVDHRRRPVARDRQHDQGQGRVVHGGPRRVAPQGAHAGAGRAPRWRS